MYGPSTRLTTKPGTAPGDQRELIDRGHEGATLLDFVLAAAFTLDDLDKRHLGDRIEEVDANEASGIGQRLRDVLDHDGGRVGRHDRARLELALDRLEQVLLDLEPLDDRLDDDIGAMNVVALGIGNEPGHCRGAQGLGLELAAEQLLLGRDALGDLLGVHVLQRHLHAGGDAPAGNVGTHDAGTDHVHAQRLEV